MRDDPHRRRRGRQRHRPRDRFQTRDPARYFYPDRQWKTGFVGGDYRWLDGDGVGGRNLDARTLFFYLATVNTPAMALEMAGVGSQYALTDHDGSGAYLDGAKNYRLTLPPDVPAKDFWSVVAYDPQTRSELQTGQPFPSKQQRTRRTHLQRRRLDRPALRPDRARRATDRQLDPDRARQELVTRPAPLRAARALVRQDLGPRRHRTTLTG